MLDKLVTKEDYEAAFWSLEGGHEYGNRWIETADPTIMDIEGRFCQEELEAFITIISYDAKHPRQPLIDRMRVVSDVEYQQAVAHIAAGDNGKQRLTFTPHPHLIDVDGPCSIADLTALITILDYNCQRAGKPYV
ncbi:hypothetical protein pEaSNUABM37_00004 [Erwinia phage pEa_SNUABM_37]|nr:hypothetical protein pEaSNUABM37_00004 [Erwinia phage pEa_SNUABM_37]QXO10474.1 hypothetical protein pEaSNUABM48_00004 [Erwinia phage pEa_SNUABM_48]